jgi:phosphoribosyl-ATP pyrophosphohydrolase
MSDSVTRLYLAALACQHDDLSTSRTARLLRSGRGKIAKKFGEEATNVVIDAIDGDRDAIIKQSANLSYNLVVLWISIGVTPEAVQKRMHHREKHIGVARKASSEALTNR